MIILFQSMTTQFRRLFSAGFFDIFCITKCDNAILSQSVAGCYYKVTQVLQSVTICYYKLRQVLQSVTEFITKCVEYYKVKQLHLY